MIRSDGDIYACQRYCTHELFPLEFGRISGPCILRCTLHGSDFDLRTGAVLGPPASERLRTYPVAVEGTDIVVELPDPSC